MSRPKPVFKPIKPCSKCKVEKPLAEFTAAAHRPDGRASACKECNAKAYREYYAKHQATELDKRRVYRANNVELVRKQARERMRRVKHLPKNKLRQEAVTLVNLLIRKGWIVPKGCETCDCPEAQAHHDSYLVENWLRVRWLCLVCHKKWHQENEPEYPNVS